MNILKNFFLEEDGQDMVEYGLVISLVVIGGVVAYTTLGNTVSNAITNLATNVQTSL